ncbi:hypothetical protein OSTOST_23312 [Ostertagia ostertagi]
MTNSSNDPIQNIALFNEYMTVFYQGGGTFNSTENSYADFIEYLRTSQQYGPGEFCLVPIRSSALVFTVQDAAASTLWTWQTCTEFGYFQSSDSSYSIFGSPTPVK